MNVNKLLIAVLGAVTLAVVGFVFVGAPMLRKAGATPAELAGGPNANGAAQITPFEPSNLPRIAVLTPKMLESLEQQNSRKPPPKSQKDEEEEKTTVESLKRDSTDLLSGQIADLIARSRRFSVSDPREISQAISAMAQRVDPEKAGAAPKPEKEARRDGFEPLWRFLDQAMASADVTITTPSSSTSLQTSSQNPTPSDFAEAARVFKATYILLVAVSEPRVQLSSQRVPDTTIVRQVVTAQPIFTYRLVDVKSGTIVLARVVQPERPVQVTYDPTSQTKAQAIDTVSIQLFERVAKSVVNDIIDTVTPAQISAQGAVTVVDRGQLDGILAGDEFPVSRAVGAQAVGANGVTLQEVIRQPFGRVRVTRVQETLAYVESITGEPLLSGDIVETNGSPYSERRRTLNGASQPGLAGAVGASPEAPALGVAMQRDAGGPAKPRVGVRDLTVAFLNCTACKASPDFDRQVEEAVLDRLKNEARIDVVSRQDTATAIAERDVTDSAAGRSSRAGLDGMLSAQYIITGTVNITPRVSSNTTTVAGKTFDLGSVSSLQVDSLVRILNPETSQVVEAAQVKTTTSGGISQANIRRAADVVASEAVAKLMLKLFPLAVLEKISDSQIVISGGRQAGVAPGARLQVYSMGSSTPDLYSTATVQSRRLVGELVVVDVQDSSATARFAAKPFDIKRGDQLEARTGGAADAAPRPASASTPKPATPVPADNDAF